jgi:iron-sulfur cluster repair protein YtfE (RIC family)
MRNGSYEMSTPTTVAGKLPEARAILREQRIDSTNRMSLREAALAVSVEPDELLAQIEARMRRAARRAAPAPAPAAPVFEHEDELAYV